jgi:hypothetical protein
MMAGIAAHKGCVAVPATMGAPQIRIDDMIHSWNPGSNQGRFGRYFGEVHRVLVIVSLSSSRSIGKSASLTFTFKVII